MEYNSKGIQERMESTLKIALISPYDHAFHGGVADHINNLSAEFKSMGHNVRVIAPCSDPTKIDDVDFIPMGRPVPIPSGGSIARVSISVWLRPRIRSLLKREKFDVIHLHEPFAGFVTLNALAVAEESGSINIGTFHTYKGTRLYNLGGKRLVTRYHRKLHGRIAVSNPAREFINRHFPNDYKIIPNGIGIDNFANAIPFEHLRDGMINLLFVGRLEKRKGLKHLLGAFSKLKWDWPKLRLLVVGPGKPDPDSYRIMSERNLKDVIFIGGVSEEEKARYYKSSDIYCSPATGGESFGIVLLEAMAASKPVIASNIAGYASVITDGEEGLLHRPKDDADLACKIEILLKDHEYRLRLASRGRERVEQFRWEHVANNVLEYYKTYLDNSSPALMPNQIPIV